MDMNDSDQLEFACLPEKEKRQIRQDYKRALFEANKMARRLTWVRETLGLRSIDVYTRINMPSATFCDREAGARTYHYEEIKTLSRFYDKLWQEKFVPQKSFPRYEDEEVVQVTIPWIMFGEDEVFKEMQSKMEILTRNFKEKEQRMSEKLLDAMSKAGK